MQEQLPELRPVRFSKLWCALGLCSSLLGCAASDTAADPAQPEAAVEVQPEVKAPSPTNSRAVQPSAAALRAALTRAGSTVQVIKRPDGLTQVDTMHGFHSASVARRTVDGRLEQTCIHSTEELDHMLGHSTGAEP